MIFILCHDAVDFRRPVEAVIPGVQGRILAVSAETTAELNLRTIARLSGVSPAQASRVLPELVALGLVERREAPPSALFALIEDNVAGRLVRALSRSREAVLEELGALADQMDPSPVSTVVFGSLARGEADALSDVDVKPRLSAVSADRQRSGQTCSVRASSCMAHRSSRFVGGGVPEESRTRPVSAAQVRAYLGKAEGRTRTFHCWAGENPIEIHTFRSGSNGKPVLRGAG